jgi:hypothetical protein
MPFGFVGWSSNYCVWVLKKSQGHECWHTPVIPATQEKEMLWGQSSQNAKPILKYWTYQTSWGWWYTSKIPKTREAEMGGLWFKASIRNSSTRSYPKSKPKKAKGLRAWIKW